jgi:hypothetical protein
MEHLAPVALMNTARVYWRSFAPAWIFPVFFLYGGLASESLGHPLLFFWGIAAPLFLWSFFRAVRVVEHGVSFWHCVFWAMLVPFVIWAGAVFSRLAYAA